MANVLKSNRQQAVLVLGGRGWSIRDISEKTGVDRGTASKYLKAAGMEVRPPGRWGHAPRPAKTVSADPVAKPAMEVSADSSGKPAIEVSADSSAKPAIQVSTDPSARPAIQVSADPSPALVPAGRSAGTAGDAPAARGTRSPRASKCEPYRDLIELAVAHGRNSVAIYQELVDRHGFSGSQKGVLRYVTRLRKARGISSDAACGIIETAPGEEAQVDYGEGPMVRDPSTGKYRRTRLFVLTLGYSRKCVRLLTWRSSARIWAELHETAFRRLGGVVRYVVLDNLKEGVLKPDIYDPEINPLYADVLEHYGATASPCRIRDPDRKGKVERAIGHTQDTALKGMRFECLEDAQAHLDHWNDRWADTRIHGSTKRQVAAMFADEKPHLMPLPVEPFRYYEFGTRTVHPDGRVEVALAYYEAPPGYFAKEVMAQWDERRVRLLDEKRQLLVEHARRAPGRSARVFGAPTHNEQSVAHWLRRAQVAGQQIGALCAAIHAHDGADGLRRIQGVVNLAKKHGASSVEDACRAGLEAGAPTYQFVKTWLHHQPQQHLLAQIDPLIRELHHYRDLIARKTEEKDNEPLGASEIAHPASPGRDGSDP